MLEHIRIQGFRAFHDLQASQFRRVNLVVGRNNSGKTCLLEAIELFATGNISSLHQQALRRAEPSMMQVRGQYFSGVELRRFFHGQTASDGSRFEISGGAGGVDRTLSAWISANAPGAPPPAAMVIVGGSLENPPRRLHFHPVVGLSPIELAVYGDDTLLNNMGGLAPSSIRFAGTGAVSAQDVAQAWAAVALSPRESLALEAMRMVEPDIEQAAAFIAPVPMLKVKLRGISEGVPLGSLGDGTGRLLYLSCQLAGAANGMLLVDEIDRGLHVSVMKKMWKLVIETARQLEAQVFATTHSDDCLRGLAACLEEMKQGEVYPDDVALFRLQRAEPRVTAYGPDEIVRSAQADIEVR